MHRTTVLLPVSLHMQVSCYAQKRGMSLGNVVRFALQKIVLAPEESAVPPFFEDTHFAKLGHSHALSQHHDEDLYS